MAMPAIDIGAPTAAVRRMTSGEDARIRRARNGDRLRLAVAAALAEAHSLSLAESIRTYASESRANGDSIHEVLDVLMNLTRHTTPTNASSAKRSCDVAEWAIAGYFEDRLSMRTAIKRARVRGRGEGIRRA